jgi:hypothetical protein
MKTFGLDGPVLRSDPTVYLPDGPSIWRSIPKGTAAFLAI